MLILWSSTSTKTIKMAYPSGRFGKPICYFPHSFLFQLFNFSGSTLSLWRKEEQIIMFNFHLVLHPSPRTHLVGEVMITTAIIWEGPATEIFFFWTIACGYTGSGFTAAINQLAYGAPPGLGPGDACGRCFQLTGTKDPYSPDYAGPFKSIVVKVTNLW